MDWALAMLDSKICSLIGELDRENEATREREQHREKEGSRERVGWLIVGWLMEVVMAA